MIVLKLFCLVVVQFTIVFHQGFAQNSGSKFGFDSSNSRIPIGVLFSSGTHNDFHFSLFRYAINYHNHKFANFSRVPFGPFTSLSSTSSSFSSSLNNGASSAFPLSSSPTMARFVPVIGQIDTSNPLAALQEVCSQSNRNIVALIVAPEIGDGCNSGAGNGCSNQPNAATTFDNIRSFASLLKIPVISSFAGARSHRHSPLSTTSGGSSTASGTSRSSLNNGFFSLLPDLSAPLDAIIRHYRWSEIIFLYTDHGPPLSGFGRLQSLLEKLNRDASPSSVRLRYSSIFHTTADANRQLENVEMADTESVKYVILDCPAEMARKIIQTHVNSVRMGRRNYHFVVARIVTEEYFSRELTLEFGGVNITGFAIPENPLLRAEHKQLAQFIRSYSSQFDGTASGRLKDNHFDWSYTLDAALLFDSVKIATKAAIQSRSRARNSGEFSNGTNIPNWLNCGGTQAQRPPVDLELLSATIEKTPLEGLTGTIQFDAGGNRRQLLIDVLRTAVNRNVTKIAHWDEQEGALQLIAQPDTGEETDPSLLFFDVTNKTFIVTSILEEPYLMLRTEKDLVGNSRFEGYSKDLAEHIAAHLNITYRMHVVHDGKYGGMVPNTTTEWNGMVGELVRHEADIAIAPLTITSARERVIDFTKPFMSLGISIMIKKPQKKNPGIFSFMDPLSSEIWVCVILAYVGVAVVLFLVSRFSPYEWRYEETVYGPLVSNDFSLYNSLWFALGAIMQQGCDVYPRSVAGRVVGSVWWFFTLILLSTYTANLAAFLTVERMVAPINSADDLAKQTEVEYGVLRDSSSMEFFRRSKIAVYQRMWDFMNIRKGVFTNSYKEGISRVRESKGKYAFLIESTHNDYINERLPCDTLKVGRNLDAKGYGVATPRGSPIREQLNLAILYLTENGDLTRLENRWWYDRSECKSREQKDTSQNALTMNNVAGCFYILISGLLLAMMIALTEFFFKARQNSWNYNLPFGDAMKSIVNVSVTGRAPRGGMRAELKEVDGQTNPAMSPSRMFGGEFH